MTFEIVGEVFPETETAASILHTPIEIRVGMRPRTNDVPARAVLAALKFLVWMESRRTTVTIKDIIERFEVSRPTAYRWARTYADARYLAWPPEKATHREPLSFPARARPVPAYAGGVH